MENAINDFRYRHRSLLAELGRLREKVADEAVAARKRELRSILKVVARNYLREKVDSEVTEQQLADWLHKLEAA